ncbi:MAG: M28 family peptidase [Planctomycetia bacterium]|nr:M28 family peptidase [Planctomycetia bacterium]
MAFPSVPRGVAAASFLAASLLLTGRPAGAGEPAAAPAPAAPAPAPIGTPAVTADEFRARVRHLASPDLEGRMSIEPGAFAASAYVAAELRRLGLAPAGPDGTYFQPFTIDLPRLAPGNTLEVVGGRASRSFEVERDWNPMAMSPSTAAAGDLVFAGFGVVDPARGYDDYAGLDVTDKVVLVIRREPARAGGFSEHATFRAKLARASERGAAALLIVNDRGTGTADRDPLLHWSETVGVTPGSALLPVAFVSKATADALLAPLGRGIAALQAEIEAGGTARPASRRVPGTTVRLRTAFERSKAKNARNVAAMLEGRDPALRDEVVVVGAHHDHVGRGWFGSAGGPTAQGSVHPGADDNASGTAALLEIAEALAAAPPRRSVLFLSFSGEELGLLGSEHFVEHPTVPLARIVTMVNLDMVGRYDPQRKLEIGGVGTGAGLQALVETANAPYGLTLAWDPQGVAPSDNTSFFRKRIPVLFFFTGLHPEYHTPRDTWETVNAEGGAQVTSLARDVVRVLGDLDARVAYTDPPKVERARAALGLVPARGSDVGGVVVAEVSEGGPAAKAGIRAGDTITAVGLVVVKDLRDLAKALAARRPGDAVVVKLLRDGAEVSVSVVLGAR